MIPVGIIVTKKTLPSAKESILLRPAVTEKCSYQLSLILFPMASFIKCVAQQNLHRQKIKLLCSLSSISSHILPRKKVKERNALSKDEHKIVLYLSLKACFFFAAYFLSTWHAWLWQFWSEFHTISTIYTCTDTCTYIPHTHPEEQTGNMSNWIWDQCGKRGVMRGRGKGMITVWCVMIKQHLVCVWWGEFLT